MSNGDEQQWRDPLDDFVSAMGAVVAGPAPQIARDEVDGLTVSTVNSIDQGYETAILDAVDVYPVERYQTLEGAIEGHQKWLEAAPGLLAVTKLSYGSLPEVLVEVVREEGVW